jgi:c(7)-type cytochrome triheme protein
MHLCKQLLPNARNATFSLMRTFVNSLLAITFVGLGVLAQEKGAPEKLVFMTKNGNVTFNHADHVKRANGDCSTCHEKLFQKSATAPLNYKPNLHKTAEMDKTSCGSCHRAAGPAFESKGNCAKCHMKG